MTDLLSAAILGVGVCLDEIGAENEVSARRELVEPQRYEVARRREGRKGVVQLLQLVLANETGPTEDDLPGNQNRQTEAPLLMQWKKGKGQSCRLRVAGKIGQTV